MKKYRKKPVVVEAERWFEFGDVPEAPLSRCGKSGICSYCGELLIQHAYCDTFDGHYLVCPGDWIIKDEEGEFYPCKPESFEKTYEDVKENL